MKNKFMCKVVGTSLAILPTLCTFAEGEGTGNTPADMKENAIAVAADIKTGFEGLTDSLKTPIGAIIIAGLGLWLIFTVVKLFKRAWNRSA